MRQRPFRQTLLYTATALLLLTAPAVGVAGEPEEEEEIPFDVASVYFELNNTDGDLGIHAQIDGGPWKRLAIEMPNERENLQIRLRDRLRRQGLTELFFESAEPTFEELDPEVFFARFPEGDYEVEGLSLEGEELESVAEVTHLLPAPPDISINGELLPSEDCDEDIVIAGEPFTISWDEVTTSHPELGRTGEPIEVELYQLVVEREEPEEIKFTFDLPSDVTELTLPEGFASSEEEWKIEVLVREESGNQTATETCFEVE